MHAISLVRHGILASLLTAAAHVAVRAQDAALFEPVLTPAVGAYAGITRGETDAAFNITRDGITSAGECGRYDHGSVAGFVVGVVGEIPASSFVGLIASVEYDHRTARLTYPCVDPAGTRMPDGSVTEALTEFRAEAVSNVLAVSIGTALRPLSLPLVITITPTLSYCASASYDAREEIVAPTAASFVEGGQSRAVGAGSFDAGDIAVSLRAAIAYEARISDRLFLVPRVGGYFGLGDELASGSLRSRGIDLTLGLTYRFAPGTPSSTPIEPGAVPIDNRASSDQ